MTTLYKFKAYYTKQGVGAAPSSAPVATVVDTDANTKLANAQATTALSNLVGYYEYEYSGADDLDLVSLFHTTDTTTDQQDLVSYVVDKVYQADKKLDVVQADLDNPDQYKADVSGLALEATLTAIKGAGWTNETLAAIDVLIDAIKAKTDALDVSDITVVTAVNGSTITVRRGDTFSGTLTNIGALTDYVSIDFTVKRSSQEADDDAIIRIRKNATGLTDGLVRLNRAAPTTETGEIVIDDEATGDITITLDETATDSLEIGPYLYDVQLITATAVKTLTSGRLNVTSDVTRAIV